MNPHAAKAARDFESRVSANSTTSALKELFPELLVLLIEILLLVFFFGLLRNLLLCGLRRLLRFGIAFDYYESYECRKNCHENIGGIIG